MIEYRVIVDLYNSVPAATQHGPLKQSLLPLLIALGLESSKCTLILYAHSNREKGRPWDVFFA